MEHIVSRIESAIAETWFSAWIEPRNLQDRLTESGTASEFAAPVSWASIISVAAAENRLVVIALMDW